MKRKTVYYYEDKYGNKRYENLTQQDRIKLRQCRDEGRPLTPKEKREIFGDENPYFKNIY